MRGLGEIDFGRISEPAYGIITNIGHTHQELLGSQERIAQGKAELISHIPYHGGMALNQNDQTILRPWLSNLRCRADWVDWTTRTILGRSNQGDSLRETKEEIKAGISFNIYSKKGKECAINLPVPGRHNVVNALLAAALARQMEFTWEMIKAGLEKVELTSMRLELKRIPCRDILIINDAYNANPASMQAALDVLKTLAAGKRGIAVLGDMYELGDYEEEGHRLVGVKARSGLSYYCRPYCLPDCSRGRRSRMNQKIRTCQDNQKHYPT